MPKGAPWRAWRGRQRHAIWGRGNIHFLAYNPIASQNSLFYKTENGAEVSDLFMSLIHTCELNDVNPFEYLIVLQKHAEELAKHPAAWMPWNYRQALPQSGTNNEPV